MPQIVFATSLCLFNYTWVKAFDCVWIGAKEIVEVSAFEVAEKYVVGCDVDVTVVAFAYNGIFGAIVFNHT